MPGWNSCRVNLNGNIVSNLRKYFTNIQDNKNTKDAYVSSFKMGGIILATNLPEKFVTLYHS